MYDMMERRVASRLARKGITTKPPETRLIKHHSTQTERHGFQSQGNLLSLSFFFFLDTILLGDLN